MYRHFRTGHIINKKRIASLFILKIKKRYRSKQFSFQITVVLISIFFLIRLKDFLNTLNATWALYSLQPLLL